MSLSPFSKTHVSKRSTSAGRSCGSTARRTLRRAHEVRDHAPTAVRGELDADVGALLGDLLERVAARDEQDRRPARDDARRARRAREERHLAEQRAVVEARERDRARRVFVRCAATHLELAARDDVRLGALFALGR